MTTYLIKMMLCSGVLLAAYFLLLEKEKMNRFNRFYLLFSLAFSLVAPLISIETNQTGLPFTEQAYIVDESTPDAEAILPSAPLIVAEKQYKLDFWLIGYFVITGLLLIRFIANLMKILSAVKHNNSIEYQGATIVFINTAIIPYSFLHFIFLKEKSYKTLDKQILHHELAHVQQHHSIDILFVELLLTVAWFNPVFWIYQKAIRMNHEYLADAAVTTSFNDTKFYQYLLINTIANSTPFMYCSSFNYLTTKKRLAMMLTKTSPLTAATRIFITVIIAGAASFFFSTKINAQQVNQSTETKASHGLTAKDTTKSKPFIGTSIGSTKEGISEELLQEYRSIIERYTKSKVAGPRSGLWHMPEENKRQLITIFMQMNPEQQNNQNVAFVKPPKPLPKVIPTDEQMENFKNPSVYGVWIDDKKVSNNALKAYQPADFSQVFISRLYGGAKTGRGYTQQLNLMTNAYYEKYYNDALQNKSPSMVFRAPAKTRIKQE